MTDTYSRSWSHKHQLILPFIVNCNQMLVSLRGSPVAIPNQNNPVQIRSVSNLAASEEKVCWVLRLLNQTANQLIHVVSKDVLVALLSNPETLNSALKDKTTCKAFIKAFNDVGKILKEWVWCLLCLLNLLLATLFVVFLNSFIS